MKFVLSRDPRFIDLADKNQYDPEFVEHVVKQMVFLDESYIGQPERYGRLLVQQSKDHKPTIVDCKAFDNVRFNGLSFPGLRVNVDDPAYQQNPFFLQERLYALYPNVASNQILVNDHRAERLKLFGQAKARRQREGNNKESGSSSGGPRKKPRHSHSLLKNVLCSLPEEFSGESTSGPSDPVPLLDMSSLDMFDMGSEPNGIDIIVAAALAGTPESYWSSSESSSSWAASPWYPETLDAFVADADPIAHSFEQPTMIAEQPVAVAQPTMIAEQSFEQPTMIAEQPVEQPTMIAEQSFEQPTMIAEQPVAFEPTVAFEQPGAFERSDTPSAIYNLFQMCCTTLSRSEFDTVCARRWTNVLMKRDTVLKCFEENDLQKAIDTISGSGYYSFDIYAKRILAEPF